MELTTQVREKNLTYYGYNITIPHITNLFY